MPLTIHWIISQFINSLLTIHNTDLLRNNSKIKTSIQQEAIFYNNLLCRKMNFRLNSTGLTGYIIYIYRMY